MGNKKNWYEIEPLIDTAMLLNKNDRLPYLKKKCGENEELYREAEKFLKSIEKADENEFLESGLQSHLSLIRRLHSTREDSGNHTHLKGTVIWPYKLKECIGEGGMGTVFLAERVDGEFDQKVAFKFLRHGSFSPSVKERFKLEKYILSRLNHPNIAKLYDGGVTREGAPYIIMEYVEGVPVDTYCNRHNLSLLQRLHLFVDICRSVQYAHSQLIIHRDLKPKNIYVTPGGQIKILDFGIAKLLDTDLDVAAAQQTRYGQYLASFQYAAPEQLTAGNSSTATDVYVLGLLLFELITGTKPFDLFNKSLKKAEQIIQHEQAPKPGLFTNETIGTISDDLDAIALKALRKEPDQRYQSVLELLEDINRFLQHLPVHAKKGSLQYKMKKFVRRQALPIAFSFIIVSLLAGFTIVYTLGITQERNEVQLQAQKAGEVTAFLIDLFETDNPSGFAGETINIKDLLAHGEERIENLNGHPEIQAQLLDATGQVYHRLGLYEPSERLLQRAFELRRKLYSLIHPETVASIDNLGLLMIGQGDYAAADSLLKLAWEIRENHLNPHNQAAAITLSNLALATRRLGRHNEAESLYRRSYQIRREHLGRDHPLTLENLSSLGTALHYQAEYHETEKIFRDVLEKRQNLFGPAHPDIAMSLNNLGALLMNRGRFNEAERLFREALDMRSELYGEEHPRVALTLNNLAIALRDQGLYSSSLRFFEQALEMRVKLLGNEHVDTAITKFSFARLMLLTEQPDSALTLYWQALHTFHNQLSENHSYHARTLVGIGSSYSALDNLAAAEQYFGDGIRMVQKIHPESSLEWALVQIDYGAFLLKKGDIPQARSTLLTALRTLTDIEGHLSPRQQSILSLLEKIDS